MVIKRLSFIIAISALLVPLNALADGAIFYPPASYNAEIGQRAVIFHDQGVETLILSIDYEGTAEEFGWIVPTPSQPEVEVSNNDLFDVLADYTYPKKAERLVEIPFFISSVGDVSKQSITILETKEVGNYESTVLSATNAQDLVGWLEGHGYTYPEGAVEIFDDYINRGWKFTTLKINNQAIAQGGAVGEGHVQPLKLTFQSEEIIYPMLITRASYYRSLEEVNEVILGSLKTNPEFVEGKNGQAVHVTEDSSLSLEIGDEINLSEGTVEMWVKSSDWETGAGEQTFWNFDSDNQSQDIGLRKTLRNKFLFEYPTVDSTNNFSTSLWSNSEENLFTENEWIYVVCSWKDNERPNFYINGRLLGQSQVEQYVKSSLIPEDWVFSKFLLGRQGINDDYQASDFYVDSIRVSKDKKNPESISGIYNSAKFFDIEDDTIFLANFDGNLSVQENLGLIAEEFSYYANTDSYNDLMSNFSRLIEVESPTLGNPGPNIPTLLYVFSDHKKTAEGLRIVEDTLQHEFQTEFAYAVDKDTLNSLLSEGGESMTVSKDYYLTKLYREVHIANIENDLTFIDEGNNDYVNEPLGPTNYLEEFIPIVMLWIFGCGLYVVGFLILSAVTESFAKYKVGILFGFLLQALFFMINFLILTSLASVGSWNMLAFGIPLIFMLIMSYKIFLHEVKNIKKKKDEMNSIQFPIA